MSQEIVLLPSCDIWHISYGWIISNQKIIVRWSLILAPYLQWDYAKYQQQYPVKTCPILIFLSLRKFILVVRFRVDRSGTGVLFRFPQFLRPLSSIFFSFPVIISKFHRGNMKLLSINLIRKPFDKAKFTVRFLDNKPDILKRIRKCIGREDERLSFFSLISVIKEFKLNS